METQTILYIILAAIAALGLAVFQYVQKHKKRTKRTLFLAFLRFVTFFALGLLIINPKFYNTSYTLEKASLVLAVDNSESIDYLEASEDVKALVNLIAENKDIQNKFDVNTFTFGGEVKQNDSIDFSENQTNITSVFKELQDIYKSKVAPTVFITDGNQTYGEAYQYAAGRYEQPIFPVIVGDTTTYQDLSIRHLNANRYAFLNNRFPVEVILNYNGDSSVNAQFEILQSGRVVYTKPVSFSQENASQILQATLPVSSIGVKTFTARVRALENERNTINNRKSFGIEVIDERTNVLILTSTIHPDLGALKKAIETNEQRLVTIKKSDDKSIKIGDYQMVILYQPNASFKPFYETIDKLGVNTFTITGRNTDYRFLNTAQSRFSRELSPQQEDYQAQFNPNYNVFQLDDIDFSGMPPLKDSFGDVSIQGANQTILAQSVAGIITGLPLLTTFEEGAERHAVLFGEGIWRWRAQSYLDAQSFQDFDDFMGKLVQYLASKKRRDRLNVDYDSFYNGGDNIIISAQYFDRNYEFDARSRLSAVIIGENLQSRREVPLVLKNNRYEADLSSLPPDSYKFTVTVQGEAISKSGSFEIIEFNVEQQFLNANVTTMRDVATNKNQELYELSQGSQIIDTLLANEQYNPIQVQQKRLQPLIDWYYLLGLIVLALSLEWFIRKYNGLI